MASGISRLQCKNRVLRVFNKKSDIIKLTHSTPPHPAPPNPISSETLNRDSYSFSLFFFNKHITKHCRRSADEWHNAVQSDSLSMSLCNDDFRDNVMRGFNDDVIVWRQRLQHDMWMSGRRSVVCVDCC